MAIRDLWRKLTRRADDKEPDVGHERDLRSDLPSGLAKGMTPSSTPGQEKPKN
jgi:hypothetical protein